MTIDRPTIPSGSLLLGVLTILATGCGEDRVDPATPDAPRVVRTVSVQDTMMAMPVLASGVLGARNETALSFTVGGVVAEVLVRPGDRVTVGQVLARLDAAEVDARLAGAEAQWQKTERDLARAERLLADSVVARVTVEDARTARDAARAAVDGARFSRRTAVVVAPASGVIVSRAVDPGSVVSAGAEVLEFAGTDEGSVFRASLPDRDLLRVRVGDAAEVRFDVGSDAVLTGRVVEVAAAPTPGLGTWQVAVAVPEGHSLPRGLTGQVTIRSSRPSAVRLIPVGAVVEADGVRGVVFTVDAGRARRHEVTLGEMAGARVVVRDGLPDATRVVVEGGAWLADAEPVRESTR